MSFIRNHTKTSYIVKCSFLKWCFDDMASYTLFMDTMSWNCLQRGLELPAKRLNAEVEER